MMEASASASSLTESTNNFEGTGTTPTVDRSCGLNNAAETTSLVSESGQQQSFPQFSFDDTMSCLSKLEEYVLNKTESSSSKSSSPTAASISASLDPSVMLRLRQYFRRACLVQKDQKEYLNSTKASHCRNQLLLENLRYEILHLKKEIALCQGFETTYQKELFPSADAIPDNMAYVDEDGQSIDCYENEFREKTGYRRRKTEIADEDAEMTPAEDGIIFVSDHEYMLKRLEFELSERKRLSRRIKDLETVRNGLLDLNEQKKRSQRNLRDSFSQWVKSSASLQKTVGYKPDQTYEERYGKNFLRLNAPLQCLYIIVFHALTNFPRASLSVGFDENAAKEEDGEISMELDGHEHEPQVEEDEDEGDADDDDDEDADANDNTKKKKKSKKTVRNIQKSSAFIQITFKDDSSLSSSASNRMEEFKICIFSYESLGRLSLAWISESLLNSSNNALAGNGNNGLFVWNFLFHGIPCSNLSISDNSTSPPFSLDYPANMEQAKALEGFPYTWLQTLLHLNNSIPRRTEGLIISEGEDSQESNVAMREWVSTIIKLMYQRWLDRHALHNQVISLERLKLSPDRQSSNQCYFKKFVSLASSEDQLSSASSFHEKAGDGTGSSSESPTSYLAHFEFEIDCSILKKVLITAEEDRPVSPDEEDGETVSPTSASDSMKLDDQSNETATTKESESQEISTTTQEKDDKRQEESAPAPTVIAAPTTIEQDRLISATIKGTVKIPIEYPLLAPVFSTLALETNRTDELESLYEYLTNLTLELNEQILPQISQPNDKPNVLTIQMKKLMTKLGELPL